MFHPQPKGVWIGLSGGSRGEAILLPCSRVAHLGKGQTELRELSSRGR